MFNIGTNILGPQYGFKVSEDETGIDPDAQRFFTATGITSPTIQTAIDTYVKTLKAAGIWARNKFIYPFVTDQVNSLTYTEDYSNVIWDKSSLTASLSVLTPPAGINSCTKIVPDAILLQHTISQNTSNLGTEGLTVSIYVKPSGYNWVRVALDFTGQFYRFWFDIQNGVFGSDNGTATLISKKATDAGGGWWRIEMTVTSNQPYGAVVIVAPQTADLETVFLADGVSGILITAAQLERSLTDAVAYEVVTASVMAEQMKYNLRDTTTYILSWSGRWGYTKNGANPYPPALTYANTGLVPLGVLNLNSTALTYYSRNDGGGFVGATNFEMGIFQGPGSLHLGINYDIMGTRARINSNSPTTGYFPATARGYFMVNTITGTTVKIAVAGLVVSTQALATDGLGSLPLSIGALTSVGPVRNQYSQKECALCTCGDGFTDAELLLLYNAGQAMNTTLGRQV